MWVDCDLGMKHFGGDRLHNDYTVSLYA
jgi:hypothetical protein